MIYGKTTAKNLNAVSISLANEGGGGHKLSQDPMSTILNLEDNQLYLRICSRHPRESCFGPHTHNSQLTAYAGSATQPHRITFKQATQ